MIVFILAMECLKYPRKWTCLRYLALNMYGTVNMSEISCTEYVWHTEHVWDISCTEPVLNVWHIEPMILIVIGGIVS
jgi:hypothetical protein